MKRKLISCASALFFLAVFNCKRDKPDPECRDASCCNPYFFHYVEYIVDEPVALMRSQHDSRYSVQFTRKFPTNSRKEYWGKASLICERSLYKVAGLPFTDFDSNEPYLFQYKVSGKLMDWSGEKYLDLPILSLYIDKIEKIN